MVGNQPDVDRRTVLKNIGASAAAVTIGSAAVSASEDDIMNSEAVTAVLDASGNPETEYVEFEAIEVEGLRYDDEPMETVKVETDIGTLVYVGGNEDHGGLTGGAGGQAHLTFDEQNRATLPRRFRTVPGNLEVGITYENGELHERREATPAELHKLETIVTGDGVDTDEIVAGYDLALHAFIVSSEEGAYRVELPDGPSAPSINDTFVPSLRASEVTVTPTSGSGGGVVPMHHCYNLGGPCAACALAAGGCVTCGLSCATGALPVCGACIAVSCGGGGIACGCCLSCLDGIHATHECTDYLPG